MNTKDMLNKSMGRRTFLAGSVTAAAAVGLSSSLIGNAFGQDNSGKQIRVLTWADSSGQAAVKNIMRTFEANTGVKVISDLTGSTSDMIAKIKASSMRPQYDVVILAGVGASSLASAGLLEKPDVRSLPNLVNVQPQYQTGADGYGIGYFLWTDGLIYNTKAYPTPPTSYEILWDKVNDGKFVLPSPDTVYAMELVAIAAKMAGGDIHKPDAGFELLKKLRGRSLAVMYNTNQISDMFRSNSLNAGAIYSPLEFSSFISNPDFNLSASYNLAEGFFVDLQYMVVPKGHPGDSAIIHQFLNHALDADVQRMMAEDVWYGPINQKVVMPERASANRVVPTPELIKEKAMRIDPGFLAEVRENWMQRYAEAVM